jgi:undecaprenyl pyrophosphate synthase
MSREPNDRIRDSKEYDKANKKLDKSFVSELMQKSDKEIEDIIVKHSVNIKTATDKLKENSAYIKACEDKALFDAGLRESLAPDRVALDFCTRILKERNK